MCIVAVCIQNRYNHPARATVDTIDKPLSLADGITVTDEMERIKERPE